VVLSKFFFNSKDLDPTGPLGPLRAKRQKECDLLLKQSHKHSAKRIMKTPAALGETLLQLEQAESGQPASFGVTGPVNTLTAGNIHSETKQCDVEQEEAWRAAYAAYAIDDVRHRPRAPARSVLDALGSFEARPDNADSQSVRHIVGVVTFNRQYIGFA